MNVMAGKLFCRAPLAARMPTRIRKLSTAPHNQVLVSQSSDLLSNAALEAWVAENMDLEQRSILVLSNNSRHYKNNLKASFFGVVDSPPQLVVQSLPSRLLLESVPTVSLLQNGSVKNLIVSLQVKASVDRSSMLEFMEVIGQNFLCAGRSLDSLSREPWMRLSLVRPDDGWFPGIGKIRQELEESLTQSEQIAKDRRLWLLRRRQPNAKLLTSFGF